MSRLANLNNNCGMGEIVEVQDHPRNPEMVIRDIVFPRRYWQQSTSYEKPPYGLIIFSGVVGNGRANYTKRLKDYIEKEGLGLVIEGEQRPNPNHPRRTKTGIKAYIWHVDHDALGKWAEANKPPIAEATPSAYW